MLTKSSNAGFDIWVAMYSDHLVTSSRTLGSLCGSSPSHRIRFRFVPTLCFRFLCSMLSSSTVWVTLSGVGVVSLCLVLSTGSVMAAGSLSFVCLVHYFLRGVGVAKFGASMGLGTPFLFFIGS